MNASVAIRIAVQLHILIPTPCFERLFVCDGLPEACDVIVIGENPAVRLEPDWWTFWDDASGFDLQRFSSVYAAKRKSEGKRPIPPTRARLNRLRSAGLTLLETNAYRNEGLGGHQSGVSNADLLQIFFNELPCLKAVIAHGKEAQRFLAGQRLTPHVRPFLMQHFRSVSYSDLDAVAREILGS